MLVHVAAVAHRYCIHVKAERSTETASAIRWSGLKPNVIQTVFFEALLIAWPCWLLAYSIPLDAGGPLIILLVSISLLLDAMMPSNRFAPGPSGVDDGLIRYGIRALLSRVITLSAALMMGLLVILVFKIPYVGPFFIALLTPIEEGLSEGILKMVDLEALGPSVVTAILLLVTLQRTTRLARIRLKLAVIYSVATCALLVALNHVLHMQPESFYTNSISLTTVVVGNFVIGFCVDWAIRMHQD